MPWKQLFHERVKEIIIKVSFELGFEEVVGSHQSAFLIESPLYLERLKHAGNCMLLCVNNHNY